jgi:glycosyltransferase involved in cell wall biosynthesis
MRVLHVYPKTLGRNAKEPSHCVLGLAEGQAQIGLDVSILSTVPLVSDGALIEIAGVRLVQPLRKRHYNPWFLAGNWIERIKAESGVPDIVHFHFIYDPFQTALARAIRKEGWPYLTTPRGGLRSMAQKRKRLKKSIANFLYYRSFIKNAAAIHALCEKEAADINPWFRPKKIIVIPNGVEDDMFDVPNRVKPADLTEFKCKDNIVLGFVGRIDVQVKGLDVLFKSFAALKRKKVPFKYLMIGPFVAPGDRNYVQSAIRSLNLDDVVKVIGSKYGDEKWSYFLAFDVFVQCSRTEGMPISLLEAMALGKPCLVTPETNLGTLVRDAGGWVSELDVESLTKNIEDIISEKNSLPERGRKAQQLVRERHSWVDIAEQMRKEYAVIIANKD